MTDEAILKQIIMKASNNGYRSKDLPFVPELAETYIHNKQVEHFIFSHEFAKAFFGTHTIADCGKRLPTKKQLKWYYDELEWLANQHGKVLENKEWVERCGKHTNVDFCVEQDDPECPCSICEAWEYHLPVMVIKEKPIQYLKDFLD